MHKFQLELLFHLIGIGSASGLIYKGNSVLLVSDNGAQLYEYRIDSKTIEKTPLFESAASENIPKKLKPDFEAIANYGDDFYIFGSGSTENRNTMVHYNAQAKTLKSTDLTNLYLAMQDFAKIKPIDFNIEGVAFTGETWYFLQRGNGKSGRNCVFTVQANNLAYDFTLIVNDYKLPKIKGVRSSFTDGVVVGTKLYFLAAAEDSKSVYDDGEVLGSFVGCLNLETMKMEWTQQISDRHKFEGITLYKNSDSAIEFLLCEDNDTETLESDIYRLSLPK